MPRERPAESRAEQLTAQLFEIQRMSTEDGPGIRTTVFFKGCSLRCSWCHNPESISARTQIVWHEHKCIGCRLCLEACPQKARHLDEAGARVEAKRCQACAECAEACPTTAIERLGEPWQLEAMLAEVSKDRAYYQSSGGGVTLSGGEPALQAPFARRLLEVCRTAGLHTAVDTAGQCDRGALLELARRADLVLFDLKDIDPERHRRHTGHSNARILENLAAVADAVRTEARPIELWIRTPLVPGATACEDNVRGIGAHIAEHLGELVRRWELCAFNNLCGDKYRRLGLEWPFAGRPLLSSAELADFEWIAKASGVDPAIVVADGPTSNGGPP